jgi:hypothetical protein
MREGQLRHAKASLSAMVEEAAHGEVAVGIQVKSLLGRPITLFALRRFVGQDPCRSVARRTLGKGYHLERKIPAGSGQNWPNFRVSIGGAER